MRWDIAIYAVIMAVAVIFLVWKQREEWKKDNPVPPKSKPVPVTPPVTTYTTKADNRSWWPWIVCLLLLFAVLFGIASRPGVREYLPKAITEATVSAQEVEKVTPSMTYSSPIVARIGHWTKVQIPCHQKYVNVKVDPADATAYFKKPNGEIVMIGCGHENDDWGQIDGGDDLFQNWQVSTGDGRPVTCQFYWQ